MNIGTEDAKAPETIARVLYRALLSRDPDATGLAHYVALLRSGTLNEAVLAQVLLDSREYRPKRIDHSVEPDYLLARAYDCEFVVPPSPSIVKELEKPEGYESWVLPHFLSFCREGAVVLDIGASIGAFALPAARRVGATGCVYAVEASPANSRLLAQSIARNGFRHVQLLPLGLSDMLGHAKLFRHEGKNNTSVDPKQHTSLRDLRTHDIIPTIPLDYLADAIRRIDVVKLDIEGMEYRVVRGAQRIFRRDRPVTFLEYSPLF